MSHSFLAAESLDGLFRNMGTMVPLLIGLGGWLIATWKKTQQKQSAASPAATDEAERTRRVREDVRRKIAERRGRRAEEEAAAGSPVAEPEAASAGEGWRGLMPRRTDIAPLDSFGGPNRRVAKVAPAPAGYPAATGQDDPAVLERQRWLAAQTRALDAALPRAVAGLAPTSLDARPPVISPWLTELRDPAGFRRAILLREILGPPVGLR